MVHFDFVFLFVFRGKKDKKQLTEANFECLAYFFGNIFCSFTMNNAAIQKCTYFILQQGYFILL